MLTVWLERGPFAPTLGWETPAGLAGTEVTALDWGADGVMYAGLTNKRGSDMLMARSDDGGQHWRSLRLTGTFVASLRADPTEPRRLYVSLLQDGVYRSADAGEHWERIDQQLPLKMVDALVVAPAGALYAGAAKDGGVYTSADHGDTWSHMSGSPDDAVFGLRWLKACPGVAGECLLAGTEHGVWRWTSNGSWIHILDHGLVFDTIQLDDHIVAVGEAVFDLPAGSTVREIAREQMTTIDMITGSKPYLVLGGLKGNLWQWRPGDTQLQSLMENTSCQTTTINIVRAAPDNGEQIWVGDNNGLHHGKWRHWYELH